MYKKSLLLLLLIPVLPVTAFAAAQKKAASTPTSSQPAVSSPATLVSWETPSRSGSERRGQAMISWEKVQPAVAPPSQPLPPLVLPKQPNFVLTTSAPMRQYDVEEETIPVPPQARD